MQTVWFAAALATFAAAAMPLGSWVGLTTRPSPRVTSALLAFGAGTLIFALSVEIVAGSVARGGMLAVGTGMIVGGVIFSVANQIVNQKGGFLRKMAVATRYIGSQKKRREAALLNRLAHVHLLQSLPPEDISPLVHAAVVINLAPGDELFREGDAGSSLYLIDAGELEVIRGGARVAILTPGETVGEMAVVTGAPRTATIRALEHTRLFYIPKPAFDHLVQRAARVRDRVSELIMLRTEELKERLLVSHAEADEWQASAAARLRTEHARTTTADIQNAAREQNDPVLGIWLGNLLDGIPEAIVLGGSVTSMGALSWPLLAGIFLDNFPEAMSSSGIMHLAGMSKRKILFMWCAIVGVSGVCGALGNLLLTGAPQGIYGFVEGTAAGAMLVMIAETTLPEAYERGGAIVGLATLMGFLASLAIKSLS
ncbi:MAG TPA: cyclic nucleotide-binding domain-containing protein [Longimicrobiales bacterium]|nr:cyclic nucleotide-binding domain-containing protein [Longimicrobiales bacterium]